MKRTSLLTVIACFALATACGGNPSVGGGGDDDDDDVLADGGMRPSDDDDDDDMGGGGDDDIVDDDDDTSGCEPKTCDELDKDCGFVADGCGDVVDCGDCGEDAACGIVTANVCTDITEEAFCVPLSQEDACDGKECGREGDGCGGTHDCGECDDGDGCGLEQPFQCSPIPEGTPDECEAVIETCAEAGVDCGMTGNGCGGVIDCDAETGGCDGDEFCGGGGPQQCGTPQCEPLTAEDACAGRCGIVSNGCGVEVDGGIIDCSITFPCPTGTACGAGGVPFQCGDASETCTPVAEATACAGRACGVVGDGCEGSYTCGTCGAGSLCRSGACEPLCVPLTQAVACAGLDCGIVSDGGSGSHNCGSCADGERCGLMQPFVCDVLPPVVCTPATPAEACAGRECGEAYDGCGTDPANIIDCAALNGGCPAGEFCGIATPFQCDAPDTGTCTGAASCAELGWECGIAFDECGNMFDCAAEGFSCNPATETCIGGIEAPAECVSGIETPSTGPCDVCDSIPNCASQPQRTRISGRVITPGRTDANTANQVGVPNAFVYILRNNDPTELPAISSGIPTGGTSCDRCDEQDLGPVLSSATTDALGNYTIEGNIPVGEEFVLVVKIGKWRRAAQMTLPAGAACGTTNISNLQTRLPRTMSDGLAANIPRVAITTGEIDAMECVFDKMGVAESVFAAGQAGGTARMHLYGRDGAQIDASDTSNPVEGDLHGDLARMMSYDMLVFDCQGSGFPDHDTSDARVREYVNRGGRMFASHLSYTWLCDNGPGITYTPANPFDTGLADAANFPGCATATGCPGGNCSAPPVTGLVSIGRPGANPAKIQNFADWLDNEGVAGPPNYDFTIVDARDLASSVNAGSEEFVFRSTGGASTSVQQFSFNTPYNAPEAAICGRVAYSGFHVAAAGGSADFEGDDFPNHCRDAAANDGDLTDQEKVLLYMLFDLGACVSEEPPEPPQCSPLTCTGRCGIVSDGCGGIVDCSCPGGQVCNQSTGTCGTPQCMPTTCPAQNAECGLIPDGCGSALDCGPCPSGEICNIQTNQCQPVCTPLDPVVACGGGCGFVSDGCGDVIECPDCAGSLSCSAGTCTDQTCTPQACPAALECGVVSDGCDGVANCGVCVPPETCGGGGEANMCGIPECDPLDCTEQDAECGWVGDGCGAAVDCGPCPMGQACGAGGPNMCAGCTPRTCEDAGAECGAIGDGCGGVVQCGPCPQGEICGAQAANQCGDGPGCMPQNCSAAGAECGLIGNGCGGVVDCGPCPVGEVCGFETPFQCDPPPPCEPTTCDEADAECGSVGDGCGDRLDCGVCPANQTCILNECRTGSGPR